MRLGVVVICAVRELACVKFRVEDKAAGGAYGQRKLSARHPYCFLVRRHDQILVNRHVAAAQKCACSGCVTNRTWSHLCHLSNRCCQCCTVCAMPVARSTFGRQPSSLASRRQSATRRGGSLSGGEGAPN